MSLVERLLRFMQPRGPASAGPEFDAELAALGITLPSPALQGEILRLAAAAGPLLPDILAATLDDGAWKGMRRSTLDAHVAVLISAGHLSRTPAGLEIAPRWKGAFAEFERLPASPVPAPRLDLIAGLTALTEDVPDVAPELIPASLLTLLGGPVDPRAVTTLGGGVAALLPVPRARLGYFVAHLGAPALAPLARFAVERLRASSQAALSMAPDHAALLDASLLAFHRGLGELLPVETLRAAPERREELLRRFCHFLGVPISRETPPVSVRRLVAVDSRRIAAELESREIDGACEAEYARLIEEERVRRKAAAESYASGRRE